MSVGCVWIPAWGLGGQWGRRIGVLDGNCVRTRTAPKRIKPDAPATDNLIFVICWTKDNMELGLGLGLALGV